MCRPCVQTMIWFREMKMLGTQQVSRRLWRWCTFDLPSRFPDSCSSSGTMSSTQWRRKSKWKNRDRWSQKVQSWSVTIETRFTYWNKMADSFCSVTSISCKDFLIHTNSYFGWQIWLHWNDSDITWIFLICLLKWGSKFCCYHRSGNFFSSNRVLDLWISIWDVFDVVSSLRRMV
jgi:hypothetical protein